MKLKGVIFDLDGTLANTLPICFAAYRIAFQEFTDTLFSDAEIAARFGPSEEGIIQNLVGDDWEKCLKVYLANYDHEHKSYREPFPGINSALTYLEACGVQLAIVTGKGQYSTEISLDYLGLKDRFELVEVGTAKGAIKSISIQNVLSKWGFLPYQVAYVGDAAYDMQAAKEVGLVALGAAWAKTANIESLQKENPAAIFRSVSTFVEWIKPCVESGAV
jgi:pyrophosphatase PpaX